jgi:hypothetical protein
MSPSNEHRPKGTVLATQKNKGPNKETFMAHTLRSKISEYSDTPIHEGGFTKRLEQQTAKIPSGGFLSLAVGSILISAALAIFKKKDTANFVGLWGPSFLLFGIYNKLVKQLGSDKEDRAA